MYDYFTLPLLSRNYNYCRQYDAFFKIYFRCSGLKLLKFSTENSNCRTQNTLLISSELTQAIANFERHVFNDIFSSTKCCKTMSVTDRLTEAIFASDKVAFQ